MQIAPEQGQLMAFLVELIGARRVLEIGCFTGYSALAMALALPADGLLITLDADAEPVEIGRRAWRAAGVAERIEVRLGLAADSLDRLIEEGAAAVLRPGVHRRRQEVLRPYYERALALVRPGGLILLDNMLWGGAVADPADQQRQTASLRALNAKLHRDERIALSLLPLGDGLTLARRRPG